MYRRGGSLFFHFFISAVYLLISAQEGFAQRIYATSQSIVSSNSTTFSPVNDISSGAVDPSHAGYTEITAPLLIPGEIVLHFPEPVPANHPVYIKVDNPTLVTAGASTSSLSSGEQITALDGSKYIVIRPSTSTSSIVIRVSVSIKRRIYHAFFEPPHSHCATVFATSASGGGLLPAGFVTDENLAVDNDINTYSLFTFILNLLGALDQTVYFSGLSNPGDAITVTFSVPNSLLSLSLISNINVTAYNGNTQVSTQNLGALLTLDLLGLLGPNEPFSISYVPLGVFDRVKIEVFGAVGLLDFLRLNEVQRTPAKPSVPVAYPAIIEICDGETATLTATSSNTGSVLRWYDSLTGGTPLQVSTTTTDTYITPPISHASNDTTFFYVAAAWDTNCPEESERVAVAVVARPRPTVAPITGKSDLCVNDNITLSSTTFGGTWVSDDPTIATVNSSTGVVLGLNPGKATIRYVVTDNVTSCVAEQVKEVTVHALPATPNVQIQTNSSY